MASVFPQTSDWSCDMYHTVEVDVSNTSVRHADEKFHPIERTFTFADNFSALGCVSWHKIVAKDWDLLYALKIYTAKYTLLVYFRPWTFSCHRSKMIICEANNLLTTIPSLLCVTRIASCTLQGTAINKIHSKWPILNTTQNRIDTFVAQGYSISSFFWEGTKSHAKVCTWQHASIYCHHAMKRKDMVPTWKQRYVCTHNIESHMQRNEAERETFFYFFG